MLLEHLHTHIIALGAWLFLLYFIGFYHEFYAKIIIFLFKPTTPSESWIDFENL